MESYPERRTSPPREKLQRKRFASCAAVASYTVASEVCRPNHVVSVASSGWPVHEGYTAVARTHGQSHTRRVSALLICRRGTLRIIEGDQGDGMT